MAFNMFSCGVAFRCGAVALLLGVSQAALAAGPFEGTWDTTWGEVRLQQEGQHVWGDYGSRGPIQGVVDHEGDTLRMQFKNGSRVGWGVFDNTDGNTLSGRWAWDDAEKPGLAEMGGDNGSGDVWTGTKTSPARPELTHFDVQPPASAFLMSMGADDRSWIRQNFTAPQKSVTPSDPKITGGPWQGTWDTTFNTLRLRQHNRFVYGDYNDFGYFEGLASPDNSVLRGRFTRNDTGLVGYVEFRKSGSKFEGRWASANASLPVMATDTGSGWDGIKTNSAKPVIRVYEGSHTNHRGFTTQVKDDDRREWIYHRRDVETKTNTPTDTSGAGQSNALTGAEHPWAEKMPIFAGKPASFKPRYIEFRPIEIYTSRSENVFAQGRRASGETYGVAGLYFTCQTDSGSRQISPFGGVSNRFFDVPRNRADGGATSVIGDRKSYRRFRLDQDCIDSEDGRLRVQLQSNMKERDAVPASDEKWGFRSSVVHFDEVETNENKGANIAAYMTDEDTVFLMFRERLDAKKGLSGRNPTVVFKFEGHFIE